MTGDCFLISPSHLVPSSSKSTVASQAAACFYRNGPEPLLRAWHLSSVIFSQLKLPICPPLGIWAELQHSPVSKVLLGHVGWAWQPCPHPT